MKSHPDQAVEVRFDGEIRENWDNGFHHISTPTTTASQRPSSDMYVQGYDGKGVGCVWQAKAPDFDMSSFSLSSYSTAMSEERQRRGSPGAVPSDNHVGGRSCAASAVLLSAASIGDIVQNHLSSYATLITCPTRWPSS